jgi:hypothetical protein
VEDIYKEPPPVPSVPYNQETADAYLAGLRAPAGSSNPHPRGSDAYISWFDGERVRLMKRSQPESTAPLLAWLTGAEVFIKKPENLDDDHGVAMLLRYGQGRIQVAALNVKRAYKLAESIKNQAAQAEGLNLLAQEKRRGEG